MNRLLLLLPMVASLCACLHLRNSHRPDPCLPCTAENATWEGKEAARGNNRPDYSQAQQCPKLGVETCNPAFDGTAYRKYYREGYENIQNERCTTQATKDRGYRDREAQVDTKADLSICTAPRFNPNEIEKAYRAGAKAYLCNLENLAGRASGRAKKYEALDDVSIGSQAKDLCEDPKRLLEEYKKSYSKMIRHACRATEAQRLGYQDGLEKSDQMSRFGVCPNDILSKTEDAYLKGYREGHDQAVEQARLALERQKHQDQLRIEQEKREQAFQLELMRQANDNANREADREMQKRLLEEATRPKHGFGGHHGGHGKPRPKGPRHVRFKGRPLTVQCTIDGGDPHGFNRAGKLKLYNDSNHTVSGSGAWDIKYYSRDGMPKFEREQWISIYIRPKDTATERFNGVPKGAYSCTAQPR